MTVTWRLCLRSPSRRDLNTPALRGRRTRTTIPGVRRAARAESRPLPPHAAPVRPRLDVSLEAPWLWPGEGALARESSRRWVAAATPTWTSPGAEATRGPWRVAAGGGGPGRAGRDAEHVEGAGAGGQSVSIGGQLRPAPRRGRGACARWSSAWGHAARPPALRPGEGGGRCGPGPRSLSFPRRKTPLPARVPAPRDVLTAPLPRAWQAGALIVPSWEFGLLDTRPGLGARGYGAPVPGNPQGVIRRHLRPGRVCPLPC